MKYNPKIHNRTSNRLRGYDYGSEGLYFLTLNTADRNHHFGKIIAGKMILNKNGIVANDCWINIPDHFPHARLHEFVIMPDHIHGIIEITENVGPIVGTKNFSSRQSEFKSPSKTIGSIIRGFKIGVTNWMRTNTNIHDVWQSNYYDHIIRDHASFIRISEYIKRNPENWEKK